MQRQGLGRVFRGCPQGVSPFNSPTRKPSRPCSARRPERRVAWLHKRRATTQCAAWLAFPSGWPRHTVSALSRGLPMDDHGLRPASRIHPHGGVSAWGNEGMTRPNHFSHKSCQSETAPQTGLWPERCAKMGPGGAPHGLEVRCGAAREIPYALFQRLPLQLRHSQTGLGAL